MLDKFGLLINNSSRFVCPFISNSPGVSDKFVLLVNNHSRLFGKHILQTLISTNPRPQYVFESLRGGLWGVCNLGQSWGSWISYIQAIEGTVWSPRGFFFDRPDFDDDMKTQLLHKGANHISDPGSHRNSIHTAKQKPTLLRIFMFSEMSLSYGRNALNMPFIAWEGIFLSSLWAKQIPRKNSHMFTECAICF
jgi:hypothetical protein